MTRSDAQALAAAWPRFAAWAMVAALVLAVGCTSARRDLPAARLADERALRAEAQAAPTAPEPLYQLALLHYGEGRAEAALAALGESLSRDRDYVPSLALLGKLLHDCGRSKEALRYFEKRGVETLAEPVRLNVALLYADAGNTMKARKILSGLEAGAWADAARVNLAYLDLLDEDHTAAASRMQSGLGRFGDAPQAVNNRAVAELRAGRVEDGAGRLKKLADAHPEFAEAQLNLALVLRHYVFDTGGAERAHAHFDALGAPNIGDPAWQRFDGPGTEDAAPRTPQPPAPQPPSAAAAESAGKKGGGE